MDSKQARGEKQLWYSDREIEEIIWKEDKGVRKGQKGQEEDKAVRSRSSPRAID